MLSPRLLLIFAAILAVVIPVAEAEEQPTQPVDSAERILELARKYEFFADADHKTPLLLKPEPLLRYSNPVRGDVYGNVFVWTWQGRPEIVGAIFDFRSEGKLDTGLHALSRPGIAGCRGGKEFWNPPAAGVVFRPVPRAPTPATTNTARRRQMGELARGFTVERNHPEQLTGEMRLLPQPIYRYSCASAKVVDGGLFVFAEATDPEAYLLLEATDGDDSQWRYALARMNIVEFRGRYQGEEVWHVDAVDWDTVFDQHEPYAIVRESPQRGLVRRR
ncbi:MAG TPA: hypothetical protein VG826_18585 [Pirellulales bacterium]|nr:hypothetical protein [Pirellulales bacterium]